MTEVTLVMLTDIVEELFDVRPRADHEMVVDCGFDDVEIAEIILTLETTFNVEITEEDEVMFRDWTMEDIVEYLNEKVETV